MIHHDANRRHDFIYVFEVLDGNPNGDPDAGNLPRIDPETNQGLVTDVCIKRKIRNWVDATRGSEAGMEIYIQNKGISLNEQHAAAYQDLGLAAKVKNPDKDAIEKTRQRMCEKFFDVRTFGAVMTTGVNCGQVRGPVQLTFARSVSPIIAQDIAITRIAVTRKEDMRVAVLDGEPSEPGKNKMTEMGRKAMIPYGLYIGYGFYNPHFAKQTGFSDRDLATVWESLQLMWDLDHSAARGRMGCRGLYVYSHDSAYGNAPSQQLFDGFRLAERPEAGGVPRGYSDYSLSIMTEPPAGVTVTRIVG